MSQRLATTTSAVERCLETLAHHAKSFNFASRVLPRACRAEAAPLIRKHGLLTKAVIVTGFEGWCVSVAVSRRHPWT